MKEKYDQLNKNSICLNCLGCNKLELNEFKGVYRCKHYTNEMMVNNENHIPHID